MTNRDRLKILLQGFALAALLGLTVYGDVTAQMAFTENTRAGLYRAASDRYLDINGGK